MSQFYNKNNRTDIQFLFPATCNKIQLIDFIACCRQQNSSSKMLQNKIILLWEPLKHFHTICKNHVFVTVARENNPMSTKL